MSTTDAFQTEPGADGAHITYCRICEALCGMVATVKDGRIIKVVPDRDNPHTQGHICVKGPALAEVAHDPDRVTRPLKRIGGPGEFVPVSWDEALDDIAARLSASMETHGPDSFALNSGNPPSLGWPSAMAIGLFARAMACKRLYTPSSEDISTPVLAGELMFGSHAFLFPDLPQCTHLLIFGSNPLVSHGSLMIAPRIREDLEAIAARGRVIVVDPRRTETAAKFEHVAVRPDSDVWLLGAMLSVIVGEGLADQAFLAEHCTGWEEFSAALGWIMPEIAADQCGVSADIIRTMAREFATAPGAAAMGRIGICRGSFSTLTNIFLLALNVVSGKFHRPGGLGWGHGGTATDAQFEGIKGPAAYNKRPSRVSGIPSVWGAQSSLTFREEMLTPGKGQIKSLFLIGANPVMSMPGGPHLAEGFAGLDLMVALDLYVTESTRHAHYILPVTTALERDDINQFFMNHMVRPFVQYVRAVIPPVGDTRSELDILSDLCRRMGRGAVFEGVDPFAMADAALRGGVEGQRHGLTLEKIKAARHGMMIEGGRWDFDFCKRIGHADRKIHLWSDVAAAEIDRLRTAPPRDVGALRFVNERRLRSINSWMHNVSRLVRSDEPRLLIHPEDAQSRNIVDGGPVTLQSQWGSIDVTARVTDAIRPGAVAYPHGWGHRGGWELANGQPGGNINAITPATPDMAEQVSGMSYLEGFDVEVRAR
ncbi:molybdopterin-dependent oxidoreductase [Sphingobium sp. EM0848]|uniref:molybdopterin-containing oxidoreductase family protein n=1 Tax=Sphingobium sp. EM0848 TaxID=2743473 RepID=UPI00159C19E7|nr:molybdopterin-dependent oxidoreductase [Sphingobium sp. EM0848]